MTSATGVQVFETVAALRQHRATILKAKPDAVIGFVPTMGALHEGHLTLVRQAAAECDAVMVSIFVNPLQFGPTEDYSRYPRTFEKDLELCTTAGATAVFHPHVEEMYPTRAGGATTVVPPSLLTERLCGLFRPGHFTGVATVVLKLFAMVQPHNAYFGEKDFQQLTVIKRMTDDMNLPVSVVPVPTVREADGLAMSSRNTYLTPDQRTHACRLFQSLNKVKQALLEGKQTVESVLAREKQELAAIPEASVQYLELCDLETLEPLASWHKPAVALVAVKLGNVRLIDNLIIR